MTKLPETTAELAPEPAQTSWYADKSGLVYGVLDSSDNLFDQNIESVINEAAKANGDYGDYNIYTEGGDVIFIHREYTPSNLRLDLELSSDQYRALVDEYGSMRHITMETIDLDQDGAMDKVAVKYVGTDGVLEFENAYHAGWGIASYIYMELIE